MKIIGGVAILGVWTRGALKNRRGEGRGRKIWQ